MQITLLIKDEYLEHIMNSRNSKVRKKNSFKNGEKQRVDIRKASKYMERCLVSVVIWKIQTPRCDNTKTSSRVHKIV